MKKEEESDKSSLRVMSLGEDYRAELIGGQTPIHHTRHSRLTSRRTKGQGTTNIYRPCRRCQRMLCWLNSMKQYEKIRID